MGENVHLEALFARALVGKRVAAAALLPRLSELDRVELTLEDGTTLTIRANRSVEPGHAGTLAVQVEGPNVTGRLS